MKTRFLTILAIFIVGIIVGVGGAAAYTKHAQQKALVNDVSEKTQSLIKTFEEHIKEQKAQKNEHSTLDMIMPKIAFEVCFLNNGGANLVKISDDKSALLIGEDFCGKDNQGKILRGVHLTQSTQSKQVVFITKDEDPIKETVNVSYEDGAYVVKRPNGYILTPASYSITTRVQDENSGSK